MSTKACKLKLCGCFGKAKDNAPHRLFELNGVADGLLPIIDDLQPAQEKEFVDLVVAVEKASVSNTDNLDKQNEAISKTLADLMDFGMKAAK